jgi:HEAT repeat protein
MNYSNCKWCGSALPEKAKKCESCGKPVQVEATPVPTPEKIPPQKTQKTRRKPSRSSASPTAKSGSLAARGIRNVLLLFALMLIGMWVSSYLKYRQQEGVENAPATQPVASEPVRIPTEQLKSTDPKVRIAACESLSKMKPPTPEIANALIGMLRDPDDSVRAMCAQYTGELGFAGADAIPVLIENLRDDTMHVRMTSADALGRIASELSEETRVIQPLMVAMEDPEPFVRRSACWSLKELGLRAEAALPAFKKGANDNSLDIRKCSMDAIADLSQSTLDLAPFVNALKHDQADVRSTAAAALAKAGPAARRAIPALAPLLNDPDEYVREAAVDALGKCCIETGETVSLLNKALLDPSHSVRKYAVLHLGAMGTRAKAAVPNLIRILSGEEIYLRVWAAEALGNMGPDAAAALPRLRQMKNEKIESVEMEAAQLPGAVDTAIRKIEAL